MFCQTEGYQNGKIFLIDASGKNESKFLNNIFLPFQFCILMEQEYNGYYFAIVISIKYFYPISQFQNT